MSEISRTLDHVKTALVSFGIAKAKEFLSQAVPGLDQHLSEAEQKHRDHGSTSQARQFADTGAFPQESGGSQPSGSGNRESDIYRASGQFEGSHQPGSGNYYSGNRRTEGTRPPQSSEAPAHEY